jgi:hypothetical protein
MNIVTVQTDQTYLGPARDLVEAGEARSGTPLSETLRQALSLALARAMRRPVEPDRLAWRLALARERGTERDALLVAEDCLIALGLFPDRVRRVGPVPAYVGVGRAAYRAAGHLEPAYGFHLMVEALRFLRGPDASGLLSLARDGSGAAAARLRGQGILVFPAR